MEIEKFTDPNNEVLLARDLSNQIYKLKSILNRKYPYKGTCNLFAEYFLYGKTETREKIEKRLSEYDQSRSLVANTFRIFLDIYDSKLTLDDVHDFAIGDPTLGLFLKGIDSAKTPEQYLKLKTIRNIVNNRINIDCLTGMVIDRLTGIIINHFLIIYKKIKHKEEKNNVQ